MNDSRSSDGWDPAPTRRRVVPRGAGYVIEQQGTVVVRVDPTELPSRFAVQSKLAELAGTCLLRGGADGILLVATDGTELARSEPLAGLGRETGLRCLLLEDGRVFRGIARAGRSGGWELVGWEVPGAYLVARPDESNGWALDETPAGRGLESIDRLAVLLAAEVLDLDAEMTRETR